MRPVLYCLVALIVPVSIAGQGGAPGDNFNNPVRLRVGTVMNIGGRPQSLALADINRDGRLDAIIGDAGLSGFSGESWFVMWGEGDGSFSPHSLPHRALTAGELPGHGIDVAAGDADGDGLPEVVVSEYGVGYLSFRFFNGSVTEARSQRYSVCASPISVSLAEANGEPGLDAFVACDDTFSGFVTLRGGAYQIAMARQRDVHAIDVDRDGRADGVFGLAGGGSLLIVRSIGRNEFRSPEPVLAGSNVNGIEAVTAGHLFPATPGPDVFFTGLLESAGQQFALPGIGNGTFGSRYGTGSVGLGPTQSAVADLNRDGLDEVVVVDAGSQALRVIQAAPKSSQFLPSVMLNVSPSVPSAVALGDVDQDGRTDAVVLDYAGRIVVYLNDTPNAPRRRAVRK